MNTLFSNRTSRVLCTCLALIFTTQTIVWSAPSSVPSLMKDPSHNTEVMFKGWHIPETLGRIESSYIPKHPDSRQPLIVHIRDSHANPEAQKNIQEILKYLSRQNKIQAVALEGAFRELPVDRFRFFKDPAINENAAETFVNQGRVTGAEAFALGAGGSRVKFYGVDDLKLYRESYAIFRRLKTHPKLKKDLAAYQDALSRLESSSLNLKLLELVRQRRQYEDNHESFASYIEVLRKAAGTHLQMDLAHPQYQFDFPSLSRFYKIQEKESRLAREKAAMELERLKTQFSQMAGKVQLHNPGPVPDIWAGLQAIKPQGNPEDFFKWTGSQGISARRFFEKLYDAALKNKINLYAYPDFLALAGVLILNEELDAVTLQSDLSKVEALLEKALAKTDREKSLLKEGRRFQLTAKLLRLEMTKQEYQDYKSKIPSSKHQIPNKLQLPNSKIQTMPVIHPELIRWAERFYELSEQRDRVFVEKTSALIRGEIPNPKTQAPDKPQNQKNKFQTWNLGFGVWNFRGAVVLVAGGFHSDGIETILKQKNIPHLVITPRITELKQDGLYEKIMLENASPQKGPAPFRKKTPHSAITSPKSQKGPGPFSLVPALQLQEPVDFQAALTIEEVDPNTAEGQRDLILEMIIQGAHLWQNQEKAKGRNLPLKKIYDYLQTILERQGNKNLLQGVTLVYDEKAGTLAFFVSNLPELQPKPDLRSVAQDSASSLKMFFAITNSAESEQVRSELRQEGQDEEGLSLKELHPRYLWSYLSNVSGNFYALSAGAFVLSGYQVFRPDLFTKPDEVLSVTYIAAVSATLAFMEIRKAILYVNRELQTSLTDPPASFSFFWEDTKLRLTLNPFVILAVGFYQDWKDQKQNRSEVRDYKIGLFKQQFQNLMLAGFIAAGNFAGSISLLAQQRPLAPSQQNPAGRGGFNRPGLTLPSQQPAPLSPLNQGNSYFNQRLQLQRDLQSGTINPQQYQNSLRELWRQKNNLQIPQMPTLQQQPSLSPIQRQGGIDIREPNRLNRKRDSGEITAEEYHEQRRRVLFPQLYLFQQNQQQTPEQDPSALTPAQPQPPPPPKAGIYRFSDDFAAQIQVPSPVLVAPNPDQELMRQVRLSVANQNKILYQANSKFPKFSVFDPAKIQEAIPVIQALKEFEIFSQEQEKVLENQTNPAVLIESAKKHIILIDKIRSLLAARKALSAEALAFRGNFESQAYRDMVYRVMFQDVNHYLSRYGVFVFFAQFSHPGFYFSSPTEDQKEKIVYFIYPFLPSMEFYGVKQVNPAWIIQGEPGLTADGIDVVLGDLLDRNLRLPSRGAEAQKGFAHGKVFPFVPFGFLLEQPTEALLAEMQIGFNRMISDWVPDPSSPYLRRLPEIFRTTDYQQIMRGIRYAQKSELLDPKMTGVFSMSISNEVEAVTYAYNKLRMLGIRDVFDLQAFSKKWRAEIYKNAAWHERDHVEQMRRENAYRLMNIASGTSDVAEETSLRMGLLRELSPRVDTIRKKPHFYLMLMLVQVQRVLLLQNPELRQNIPPEELQGLMANPRLDPESDLADFEIYKNILAVVAENPRAYGLTPPVTENGGLALMYRAGLPEQKRVVLSPETQLVAQFEKLVPYGSQLADVLEARMKVDQAVREIAEPFKHLDPTPPAVPPVNQAPVPSGRPGAQFLQPGLNPSPSPFSNSLKPGDQPANPNVLAPRVPAQAPILQFNRLLPQQAPASRPALPSNIQIGPGSQVGSVSADPSSSVRIGTVDLGGQRRNELRNNDPEGRESTWRGINAGVFSGAPRNIFRAPKQLLPRNLRIINDGPTKVRGQGSARAEVRNQTVADLPNDKVFKVVRAIIVEQLDVRDEAVTLSAKFIEDLGADSLDRVEIVRAFEDEFETKIPDEAAQKMVTVGDVVFYMESIEADRRLPDDLRSEVRGAVKKAETKDATVEQILNVLAKRVEQFKHYGETQINSDTIEGLLGNSLRVTPALLDGALQQFNQRVSKFLLVPINGEGGNMYWIQPQKRSELRTELEVSKIAFGFFTLVPQESRPQTKAFLWKDLIQDQIVTAPVPQNEKGLSFVIAPEIPDNITDAAAYFSHLNGALRENPGLYLTLLLKTSRKHFIPSPQPSPNRRGEEQNISSPLGGEDQGEGFSKSIQTFFEIQYPGTAPRFQVLSTASGRELARVIQRQMARQGIFGKGNSAASSYSRVTLTGPEDLLNGFKLPVNRIQNDLAPDRFELQAALAEASGRVATRRPYELIGLNAERIKQLGAVSRVLSALHDLGFKDHLSEVEAALQAAYHARVTSYSA